MNKFFKLTMVISAFVAVVGVMMGQAQESKYAAGTSSAAVTFGPGQGRLTVSSIYATTDKSGAAVKLYAQGGAGSVALSAVPTATTVVSIANASYDITNSDLVVYAHANGVMDYRTVSSAATNSVTLDSAISSAGTSADRLYEITLQGRFDFDTTGATVGSNKYAAFEGPVVWCGIGPVHVAVDGTSNAVLTTTAVP